MSESLMPGNKKHRISSAQVSLLLVQRLFLVAARCGLPLPLPPAPRHCLTPAPVRGSGSRGRAQPAAHRWKHPDPCLLTLRGGWAALKLPAEVGVVVAECQGGPVA